MPWEGNPRGGFSTGEPWLPVPAQHLDLAVSAQERDASSALQGFRRLLAWRKNLPLLLQGDIEFLAATDSVLAFRRFDGPRGLLAAFNLSGTATTLALPGITVGAAINGHGLPEGSFANASLQLPGHGVAFYDLPAL
jgi:alpha-glucosidase